MRVKLTWFENHGSFSSWEKGIPIERAANWLQGAPARLERIAAAEQDAAELADDIRKELWTDA